MQRTLIPYFWPSITLYLPLVGSSAEYQPWTYSKLFPLRDTPLQVLYSLVSRLDRFLVPDMSLGSRLLLLPNGEMLGPTEVPCRLFYGSDSREEACQKHITTGTQKHGLTHFHMAQTSL